MELKHTQRMNLALITGSLVAAIASPAHSDLKIVSEVTVAGLPQQAQSDSKKEMPRTVTTYYKGQEARVEAGDGTVTIYDRAADQVYTLHPADRTYSVVPLKKMLEQGPELTSQMPANRTMKLESKVDLTKEGAVEKRTIAGNEAVKYSLTGSVTMQRESRGGSSRGGFPGGGRFPGGGFPGGRRFPGGGFPGGGRFPGGGYPGGGSDGGGRRGDSGGGRGLPSIQVDGEYWIADTPRLVGKTKTPLLPSIAQTVPAGPYLSSLNDKLTRTKGFPVASKVTVTTTTRQSTTPTTITTATEVRSITDAPLDESLFKVPADYKEVAPQPVSAARQSENSGR